MIKTYKNIEYIKGVVEDYEYAFMQPTYDVMDKAYRMYNGTITHNTLSDSTLEKMITCFNHESVMEDKTLLLNGGYHRCLSECDGINNICEEYKR